MTNKNNNKNNTSESSENIDKFLKNLDIQFAIIEKLGSAFILLGYALFIYASNLDIRESLDLNNNGITPSSVILQGGELMLYGYILLFIVADGRLKQKQFENSVTSENNILSPYIKLYYAYIASIFMNILRVSAFSELDYINRSGEAFV